MTERTEIEQESNANRTGFVDLSKLDHTMGRHTGVQVAADCQVSEGAIRQWYSKLCAVCPVDWLRSGGSYTDLARALFLDYAERVSRGQLLPEAWSVEIAQQYKDLQPLEQPVMPVEASIVLQPNGTTSGMMTRYLEQMEAEVAAATHAASEVMDALDAEEAAQLQAEIAIAAKSGARKGAILYAAEQQGKNATIQALRQQGIARKQQGGQQG